MRVAAPTGHPGGPECVELPVPNNHVGLIIGRGGTTIKMIQDRTCTHVQIPKIPDEGDPSKRTIVISGQSRAAVEDAKREILNVLGDNAVGASPAAPSSGSTSGTYGGALGGGMSGSGVTVVIPNDRAGLIIGSRGATIHEIQQRTMTHVQIPQFPDPGSNPPVRTVTITGNPEGCEQARTDIYNLVQVRVLYGCLCLSLWCDGCVPLCSNVQPKLVVVLCPFNRTAGFRPTLGTRLPACTVQAVMAPVVMGHTVRLPLGTTIRLRMLRTTNSMAPRRVERIRQPQHQGQPLWTPRTPQRLLKPGLITMQH
jgi:hypothetical protein